MTYHEALTYLESLNHFGIRLGLMRIEKLLGLLGNPEKKYKTIHVTGTNGKGSTSAMIAAILQTSGIKTALYTSPHLTHYCERMQIGSEPMTEEAFAATIAVVKDKVSELLVRGGEQPTQFEVLTAAAFYYFACAEVEYAVIEVGLGGLLDSTNVILPEIAVITNVALEHTDYCGKTVEAIAGHKAGIIKDGVPVVTAAEGSTWTVIANTAKLHKARIYSWGQEFFAEDLGIRDFQQSLYFHETQPKCSNKLQLNLLGYHQVKNCALAVMTAIIIAKKDKRICWSSIEQGLLQVKWPARFEILSKSPFVIVDGAHNPAGAQVLRKTLDTCFEQKSIVFVFGVLKDKDYQEIIRVLIRPTDKVVVVMPESERAGQPAVIAREISADYVLPCDNIKQGIAKALELVGQDGILCVAGSLYLAGAARDFLHQALER